MMDDVYGPIVSASDNSGLGCPVLQMSVPQISVWPCRGVLQPSASCSVDVVFTPHLCREYDTELQLTVADGQEV